MLARPHPVLGWLHCQPQDSRRLLDRQLTLRDKALEADPSFSGMPASFVEETWVNWLPKAVAQPFYRNQLTAHVAELERQITNLSQEIERQTGGLLDQRDAAVDLGQRLVHACDQKKGEISVKKVAGTTNNRIFSSTWNFKNSMLLFHSS